MKRFGVGRPFSVSREPSVPPRISVRVGSSPTRRIASSRALDDLGPLGELVAHVAVLDLFDVRLERRARLGRGDLVEDLPQERDMLVEQRVVVVADDESAARRPRASPRISSTWMNPSRSSVVSGESVSRGSRATNSRCQLERVDEPVLAQPGCTRGRGS